MHFFYAVCETLFAPQMYLNIEFEYIIYVPLNVLELIAVILNVLENVISTLPCILPKFW